MDKVIDQMFEEIFAMFLVEQQLSLKDDDLALLRSCCYAFFKSGIAVVPLLEARLKEVANG